MGLVVKSWLGSRAYIQTQLTLRGPASRRQTTLRWQRRRLLRRRSLSGNSSSVSGGLAEVSVCVYLTRDTISCTRPARLCPGSTEGSSLLEFLGCDSASELVRMAELSQAATTITLFLSCWTAVRVSGSGTLMERNTPTSSVAILQLTRQASPGRASWRFDACARTFRTTESCNLSLCPLCRATATRRSSRRS